MRRLPEALQCGVLFLPVPTASPPIVCDICDTLQRSESAGSQTHRINPTDKFVQAHHRHAGRVNWGTRFALAVADEAGEMQAVCIVSHRITRALNHDGFTAEVRRVCTNLERLTIAARCSTALPGTHGAVWVAPE